MKTTTQVHRTKQKEITCTSVPSHWKELFLRQGNGKLKKHSNEKQFSELDPTPTYLKSANFWHISTGEVWTRFFLKKWDSFCLLSPSADDGARHTVKCVHVFSMQFITKCQVLSITLGVLKIIICLDNCITEHLILFPSPHFSSFKDMLEFVTKKIHNLQALDFIYIYIYLRNLLKQLLKAAW